MGGKNSRYGLVIDPGQSLSIMVVEMTLKPPTAESCAPAGSATENAAPIESILDALPANIALLDGQGSIVKVNAAWRRFARENAPGQGAPAVIGAVDSNYLAVCDAAVGPSAEGAAAAATGIREVLAGRQAGFSLEYPCHSPEQQRWFLMSVAPCAAPHQYVVVTHVDITQRKLIELAQVSSELRLQLALEATGDGLWDWDLTSNQAYFSPGYYALTGYRAEEVRADFTWFKSLIHSGDLPGVMATIEAYLRGDTTNSEVEFRMVTASGALRWIRGRGRVVERDATGTPLRMVGLITDIREQKRLEHALRESEARYRMVLEDQTEIILRFRTDGTIVYANEVYCRLVGKPVEEIVGRRWQPVAHPDDLPMIVARLAELSPAQPVVVIENRIYDGQGEVRWMQFVNRAFFDAAGGITEIQVVGRDITERKRIEARKSVLREENTRLARELIDLQDKERAHLARELHDELSQQLVAIRAHAAAIRRRAAGGDAHLLADAAAIEASASQIYAASHRLMEGLHPQLLDSAGLDEALRMLLLGAWLDDHRDIQATLRLAGKLDDIGDEVLIHLFRIAQGCLSNVALHARASRVRVFLGERWEAGRRVLRLVIRDDGVGMDPAAEHGGLGLRVMQERARNLGGSFVLQSWPGAGTRVVVEVRVPPAPRG